MPNDHAPDVQSEYLPDEYAAPYIGMHFVSATKSSASVRAITGIASHMPDVPRQNRKVSLSFSGYNIKGEIPETLADQFEYGFDRKLWHVELNLAHAMEPAVLDWLSEQDFAGAGCIRHLRRSTDDPYQHAAWHVEVDTPSPFCDDSPLTEMNAICAAAPIIARDPTQQSEWVKAILESACVGESPWDYGYIEIGDWMDLCEGRAYTPHMGDLVRWRRQLEYCVWECYGMLPANYKKWQQKYPVKGVYWGNYFGPAVLDRIGGSDRLKALIDERRAEDKRNGWYMDAPGGAFFVALSDRLSDAAYDFNASLHNRAINNGVYLWEILREANVMI